MFRSFLLKIREKTIFKFRWNQKTFSWDQHQQQHRPQWFRATPTTATTSTPKSASRSASSRSRFESQPRWSWAPHPPAPRTTPSGSGSLRRASSTRPPPRWSRSLGVRTDPWVTRLLCQRRPFPRGPEARHVRRRRLFRRIRRRPSQGGGRPRLARGVREEFAVTSEMEAEENRKSSNSSHEEIKISSPHCVTFRHIFVTFFVTVVRGIRRRKLQIHSVWKNVSKAPMRQV